MEKLDSGYKKLLPDDVKLFDDLLTRYTRKRLEDLNELYEISTASLILSARWCEIQSTASVVAKLNNISKTDFQNWAYQHYRTLQEMHIDCRSLYKCCREDLKNNLIQE